ncbi:MAG: HD domain-containing protein [Deltaproteobacteria bacterium]|nr:HD domain-containing protein [Deltaproteobacteria bacterium]
MAEETIEDVAAKQKYYVAHLADVNKETDVISTEDIFNSSGVMVVPKGTRISQDVARKVLRHKLIKSLEDQVQVSDCIDKRTILDDLQKLLAKYKDLQVIHLKNNFEEPFAALVEAVKFNTILVQKLTVLKKQLIKEYDKSLFCGWLSALISHRMGLEKELVEAAFLAGFFHDIGLLNVAPQTLEKGGELTADEWRAIQSHVAVGKLIFDNMHDLHAGVARAVFEHHERCDGSGYPTGKSADELDIMGQIVGMADSMHSIRVNQFERHGRNLRDALPYLHMNSRIHFQKVYEVMCGILKKSGLPRSKGNPFGDYHKFVEHLVRRAEKLNKSKQVLDPLIRMVETVKNNHCVIKLGKIVLPVSQMVNSSGLLEERLMHWLKSLEAGPDQASIEDLSEVELMQNELYWQMKKLHKTINDCAEKGGSKISPALRKALESFSLDMHRILSDG